MHSNRNAIRSEPKQPACFNHLESLVHQSRGVDGDLRSHLPGWMRERFLDCCFAHAFERSLSKGSTGSGEYQPLDLARLLAPHALMKRVVLAVDRKKLR